MNCLLLLLAFELVTSDKLDRTYLPPPGAKFAGGTPVDLQTPLEYPKTELGTIQDGQFPGTTQTRTIIITGPENQGLDEGMLKSVVPIDYSTSTYPVDFSQTPSIPSNKYDSTKISPSRPDVISYGSFPAKSSDVDYSRHQVPTAGAGFETNNIYKGSVTNGGSMGYDYFVPAGLQTFRDDKTNKGLNKTDSDSDENFGLNQYPDANNGYLLGNGQRFVPKTASSEDVVQNYEPSSFGYYGGNPMIMTSKNSPQREFGDKITPKYGEYESDFPTISESQDEKDYRSSVLPFQTPLVGTINVKNARKSNVAKSSTSPPKYTDKPIYPPNKENVPIILEQRKNFPGRQTDTFRPERPQAETDRNAVILNYDNIITPQGYSYSFDTSNGIHKDESGTANSGVRAKGSYSYTGDDGKIYSVTYTADENGFQPIGDHLPTPPPVPEAIKKVIEQAAKDKAAGIVDDGSYDERKYGYMNYQGAIDRHSLYYKERGVPKVTKHPVDKLSRLTEGQKETNMANENKEAYKGPVNKGEVLLTSDKKTIGDQLTNKLPSNLVREQIEPKDRLSQPTNRKLPIGSPSRIPVRNQQISSRNRPVFDANGTQRRVLDGINADNMNQLRNKNMIQKQPDADINSLNQDDGHVRYQKERLNHSVFKYNQNEGREKPTTEKFFQTESPDLGYKPNNIDSKVYNKNQPDPIPQVKPLSPVTSYDNGYLYVPPITKFQHKQFKPNIEQSFNNENSYITTGIPTQYDFNTSVNKRTGFDSTQYPETINESQTSIQNEDNVINDSTREPYISGPSDQGNVNFYEDTQSKLPKSDENIQNKITTLTNDLESSYYVSTTTPLPIQSAQFGNPLTDGFNINQYYQTTINPAIFEQNLPNTVENRLNIPNGPPEIRVSQDVITSTYRPGAYTDGINLEVNQNVKIYGVGRPVPTDVLPAYPDKVTTLTDGFFTAANPGEENRFTGTYPDINFRGPAPDNRDQSINQDLTFGDDIFSTESPVTGIDTSSNGYYYPIPGRQPHVDLDENLKKPNFIPNDFGFVPGEDRTTVTPSYTTEVQSQGGRVIGEDFSGPKQPQRFDPETGYLYK